MSNCQLSKVSSAFFRHLQNLLILDLSRNKLRFITNDTFSGLNSLRLLKLSENKLTVIQKGTLHILSNLESLDLSSNVITGIEVNAFSHLRHLKFLDVSNNNIAKYDIQFYVGLDMLETMITDSLVLCCVKPESVTVKNCYSQNDILSSCNDLLENTFFRACVWFILVFSLGGNIASVVYKYSKQRTFWRDSFNVLLTNLSISNFLMSLYLLIIAHNDLAYIGVYVWNDHVWRSSNMCRFAGVLSVVAFESSVILLTCFAVERLFCVQFRHNLSKKVSVNICICAWFMSFMVAIYPLVSETEAGLRSYYSLSKACFTFHITKEAVAKWPIFALCLVMFNWLGLIFILSSNAYLHIVTRGIKTVLENPDRRREVYRATRVLILSATYLAALVPVCIFGRLNQ